MKFIRLSRMMTAIVDDEDFDLLSQWRWTFDPTTGYAYRREYQGKVYKKIYMHRQIMGNPKNKQVDHISRGGLDNRRLNLRICSRSDNQHNRGKNKNNTTGYKNINREGQGWRVQVMHKWKTHRSKLFNNVEDAIRWRDITINKLHGDFGRTE